MSWPNTSGWTSELEAEAIRLFNEGYSATQVAVQLRPHGLRASRSAVAGMLHRRGVTRGQPKGATDETGRQHRDRSNGQAAAVIRAARRTAAEPAGAKPAPVSRTHASASARAQQAAATAPCGPVPLERLRRLSCRFPVGAATGADQLFCGEAQEPGCSYCALHRRVVSAGRVALAA